MKINIKSNNAIPFEDVCTGDTFLFKGKVYMKIFNDEYDSCHAVSLDNGCVDNRIDDTDDVIIVDTELNVNNLPF